jgi:hypothetical protein
MVTYMKNFYEENLNALMQVDPGLATSILSINENKRFEVFQGKDTLDINILDTDSDDFLYEKPLEELQQKADIMHNEYVRYPVLFFYGIGNGLLSKVLLQNESLMHLVVVEPNIEMLYIALNFIDVSEEILSNRLIIKTDKDIFFANIIKIIELANIRPYAKIYDLHIHSEYYTRNYRQSIQTVNEQFIKTYKHIVIGHGNDANDSLIGIEQHIANMLEMFKSYKTKNMFKKKNSEVAVIVSTGPSLTKQLPLLKEYADYMTIISVDASLPILQKHGIVPDFVTSIERVIESASFFDNVEDKTLKDTYFVVSSLADPYTVHKLRNQKLMLSMRPLSYMLYYNLHDFGYLGSGMSAANLAYQLAAHMSYKDIVLIGQDLAYNEQGISHAEGHKYIKNEEHHKDTDTYVEAYGGEGVVKTSIIWNMFKNFFENDIYEAKECCGMTTYNSTEGGARIINSIEKPFKDVLEKLIDKEKTPKKTKIRLNRVNKNESEKLIAKAKKKTDVMEKYGRELKTQVEELFLKVVKNNELIEKQDREEVDYNKLLKLIEEIDVIKAEVESDEFSRMYTDTVQSYIFHQELNIAKLMVENSRTDEEKKEKLIKWAKIHQYWLFSLAGGIESQLYAIDSGRSLINDKANEFKFMDYITNLTNNEEVKELFCKNAIGFIATEENINDKEFINYLHKLQDKFPQVTMKAFYFNDKQKNISLKLFEKKKIETVFLKDISDIAKNIEIFISKPGKPVNIKLAKFCDKIVVQVFNNKNFGLRVCDLPQNKNLFNNILNNLKYDFTKDEISEASFSVFRLLHNKLFKLADLNKKVNDDDIFEEHSLFSRVECALKSKKAKEFFILFNKTDHIKA